jgi:methylenetetrahydrofolate reductase (NADPH)
MGVSSILCLTGDGVQAGDQPDAKPVFDFDCMSLLQTVAAMRDRSELMSGRPLTVPPKVFIGAAANPFAPPLDYRPLRLQKKIEAGAQFVQTQYCFDLDRLTRYMRQARDLGLDKRCFILVGVGPLASARTAAWLRDNVPGVHIPDAIIKRLLEANDQKEEGIRICVEMIQAIREIEGVHGVHVMAYRQEHRIPDIIGASGVLAGRVPWYPGCTEISPQ